MEGNGVPCARSNASGFLESAKIATPAGQGMKVHWEILQSFPWPRLGVLVDHFQPPAPVHYTCSIGTFLHTQLVCSSRIHTRNASDCFSFIIFVGRCTFPKETQWKIEYISAPWKKLVDPVIIRGLDFVSEKLSLAACCKCNPFDRQRRRYDPWIGAR
jgi:hypothetical protein